MWFSMTDTGSVIDRLHLRISLKFQSFVWQRYSTFIVLSDGKVNIKLSQLSTTPWRCILCLIMYHAMKTYWGSGGLSPLVLSLGTGWRWVVSFTLRSLYARSKSPRDCIWWAPESVWTQWRWQKIPSLSLPRIEPRSSSTWPSIYSDCATTASKWEVYTKF